MVTPLYIEIMLHYSFSASEFERADAPACMEALHDLTEQGMLRYEEVGSQRWHITEKGKAWIVALCYVPFPQATWKIPGYPDLPADYGNFMLET